MLPGASSTSDLLRITSATGRCRAIETTEILKITKHKDLVKIWEKQML